MPENLSRDRVQPLQAFFPPAQGSNGAIELGRSWMLVGCGRRVKQRDDRHMALARAGRGPILDAAFTCSQRPGRLLFCPSEVEKDKPC